MSDHPPPTCNSPELCSQRGYLERCRICVETFYWEEGLTIEQGDAWREDVLNPKCEPVFVATLMPDGRFQIQGGSQDHEDALSAMITELADILGEAVVADNDNT